MNLMHGFYNALVVRPLVTEIITDRFYNALVVRHLVMEIVTDHFYMHWLLGFLYLGNHH